MTYWFLRPASDYFKGVEFGTTLRSQLLLKLRWNQTNKSESKHERHETFIVWAVYFENEIRRIWKKPNKLCIVERLKNIRRKSKSMPFSKWTAHTYMNRYESYRIRIKYDVRGHPLVTWYIHNRKPKKREEYFCEITRGQRIPTRRGDCPCRGAARELHNVCNISS